jgi:hypothetical protein
MACVLSSLLTSAFAQTADNGLRGMALSPLMFRNEVAAGSKVKLALDVENLQQTQLTVNIDISPVTFADWSYIPTFGVSHQRDCANWFTIRQINRIIGGGTHGEIDLEATIPHLKPDVYWCMARVTPHYLGDPSTIVAQYQLPIVLFIGRHAAPSLKLGSPELLRVGDAPQISIPYENSGDGFTTIGANVQLKQGSTGRVLGTYFDNDRNLFPGTKRNLVFSPGPLANGQYILTSKAQAGTRSFSAISRRFVVSKEGIRPETEGETLQMSPVSFDVAGINLKIPAGGSRSAVVHLINNSDATVTVKVMLRALNQNELGGLELGTDPPTGNLTVTADPETLQVEPRRSIAVRLAIATAKGATGDQWFGIAAKTDDPKQIAEELYGSVVCPGGVPKLELSLIAIKKMGKYPISLSFSIKNTGTMSLKPIPFAQVLEQGLTPVATLQVPTLGTGGVLPGSILTNEVMLPPTLKPGAYTVNVKYQYGEDLFAELTVPITVSAVPPKGKGGK